MTHSEDRYPTVPLVIERRGKSEFRCLECGEPIRAETRWVSEGSLKARSEWCLCGAWIVATDPTPENIMEAVRAHQQTALHRTWWQNGGFEQRRLEAA